MFILRTLIGIYITMDYAKKKEFLLSVYLIKTCLRRQVVLFLLNFRKQVRRAAKKIFSPNQALTIY